MATKKKLQVYLDTEQERSLRLRSGVERRPMAELAREAIVEYLAPGPGRTLAATDPFWSLVGAFEGPRGDDASTEHDHYLYGAPKRAKRRP